MQIIHTVSELRQHLASEPIVDFVPTMGNLHEGHLDLVRIAREHGHCVVVSIFVNPLQFGPNEDFDKYPRTLPADCEKLQGLADVVFAPAVPEMYPEPQTMYVEPPSVATELCGAFRPGHFRGVATVVMKLFNIVQPQVSVFGKKDYQQLAIIRQMVTQFNLPIQIIGAETKRAADGLALSSRNQYLSEKDRTESVQMNQILKGIVEAVKNGECNFAKLEDDAMKTLESRGWQVDYVAIRRQKSLLKPEAGEKALVVLAAAKLGNTRLIDNIEIFL
jgi:pantoate--beta-alanine ligase